MTGRAQKVHSGGCLSISLSSVFFFFPPNSRGTTAYSKFCPLCTERLLLFLSNVAICWRGMLGYRPFLLLLCFFQQSSVYLDRPPLVVEKQGLNFAAFVLLQQLTLLSIFSCTHPPPHPNPSIFEAIRTSCCSGLRCTTTYSLALGALLFVSQSGRYLTSFPPSSPTIYCRFLPGFSSTWESFFPGPL